MRARVLIGAIGASNLMTEREGFWQIWKISLQGWAQWCVEFTKWKFSGWPINKFLPFSQILRNYWRIIQKARLFSSWATSLLNRSTRGFFWMKEVTIKVAEGEEARDRRQRCLWSLVVNPTVEGRNLLLFFRLDKSSSDPLPAACWFSFSSLS